MKLLIKLFALMLVISISSAFAQSESESFSIGKIITINSKALNQERQIIVNLPDEYNSTNQRYPVLYVLNSEQNFKHAVGTESYLAETQIIPKHIVVGIDIKNIKS